MSSAQRRGQRRERRSVKRRGGKRARRRQSETHLLDSVPTLDHLVAKNVKKEEKEKERE